MTEEQIMDHRNDAAVHYYGLLLDGRITSDTYVSFMRDLHAWAEAKRVSRDARPLARKRTRRLTSD